MQNAAANTKYANGIACWPVSYTHLDVYKRQRMPRLEVADKVLDRLLWAESNIGNTAIYEKNDGSNTINQNCVRAAISVLRAIADIDNAPLINPFRLNA